MSTVKVTFVGHLRELSFGEKSRNQKRGFRACPRIDEEGGCHDPIRFCYSSEKKLIRGSQGIIQTSLYFTLLLYYLYLWLSWCTYLLLSCCTTSISCSLAVLISIVLQFYI